MTVPSYADIVRWDDSTLIGWRREARKELERNPRDDTLQRAYDASTVEVSNRARVTWRAQGV